jgi:hypothetical protein
MWPRTPTWAFIVALVLHLAGGAAALPRDADEPPVAGRPAGFRGAVGRYVSLSARAEPTELRAEEPFTLTLRITAAAPPRRPPIRPALKDSPAFTRRFTVENVPDFSVGADSAEWEFRYRLRPLGTEVSEVPAVRFDFFRPGLLPPEKGYQALYSEPIPLTVRPRPRAGPADVRGAAPPTRPASLYELARGPGVLRRDEPADLPAALAAAILLVPPVLCLGGLAARRWLYAATPRRARSYSRAAREALRKLEPARRKGGDPDGVTAVVSEYLRRRWGLGEGEPTPRDVAAHLGRHGRPAQVAERCAEFFKAGDAARFGARSPTTDARLAAAADRVIRELEESP